jgi:hypothetical protein
MDKITFEVPYGQIHIHRVDRVEFEHAPAIPPPGEEIEDISDTELGVLLKIHCQPLFKKHDKQIGVM